MFYNIVSAVLQIAVTAFVGYGFARFKFKGRGVLFAIALFTIIVPATDDYNTDVCQFFKF